MSKPIFPILTAVLLPIQLIAAGNPASTPAAVAHAASSQEAKPAAKPEASAPVEKVEVQPAPKPEPQELSEVRESDEDIKAAAKALDKIAVKHEAEPAKASAEAPAPRMVEAPAPEAPKVPETEARSLETLQILARKATSAEEYDLAEHYYQEALSMPVSKEKKRDCLIEIGRLYEEKKHKLAKAATVYEQVLQMFPNDAKLPELSLRLGRIYRELGSFKSSINKLYNVLHTSLRVTNGEEYMALVRQAQYEIAQSHFAAGNYAEAATFFSRLKKIDMPPKDQSEVYFKSAYILFLNKDYAGALTAAQEFLPKFPTSDLAPEAQYLVVQSLKALNRYDDAVQETLKLLRAGKEYGKKNPKVWAYWQQKTGNDLANELYGKGDYLNALTVFQTLASLSESPEWRWPAIYQIALCFERLRYYDRALEAYSFLTKNQLPESPSDPNDVAKLNLGTVREAAQWRLNYLKWATDTDAKLTKLLARKPEPKLANASFMTPPPSPSSSQPASSPQVR